MPGPTIAIYYCLPRAHKVRITVALHPGLRMDVHVRHGHGNCACGDAQILPATCSLFYFGLSSHPLLLANSQRLNTDGTRMFATTVAGLLSRKQHGPACKVSSVKSLDQDLYTFFPGAYNRFPPQRTILV